MTNYGYGYHLVDVPLELVKHGLNLSLGLLTTYTLAICLTKVSILLFYIRIICVDPYRRIYQATLAIVGLYTIPLLLGAILHCDPSTGKWAFGDNVKCIPFNPMFYASAILNILTDAWLIISIIPPL